MSGSRWGASQKTLVAPQKFWLPRDVGQAIWRALVCCNRIAQQDRIFSISTTFVLVSKNIKIAVYYFFLHFATFRTHHAVDVRYLQS